MVVIVKGGYTLDSSRIIRKITINLQSNMSPLYMTSAIFIVLLMVFLDIQISLYSPVGQAMVRWSERLCFSISPGLQPQMPYEMFWPHVHTLHTGYFNCVVRFWFILKKKMLLTALVTVHFWALTSIMVPWFIFTDGVGHLQSDRMCNSYLPKHECVGSCMATCSLFGMQLCAKVSTRWHSTARTLQCC